MVDPALLKEAKQVASMYRKVGHTGGIENLLDRLVAALEESK